MSFSLGGNKSKQKGTSSIDNTSQDYLKQIMAAAKAAGAAGPSPLVGDAANYNSGMMKQGNLGMGALSGDTSAVNQLMNPYMQNVIGATNNQWDKNDQHTMNAVNDRATQAGAFGGSRHGVATGTALAGNNLNRNSQVSGLLSDGFNGAMDRAGTLAGYGYMGSQANANLGMGGVGNPQQWLMEMLKKGFVQPLGGAQNGSGYGLSGAASGVFGGGN